ncbi:hypothetical protein [Sulfurimonas sp.]|uniref:hypothetical protein n=1 Tax=Sulfurimonas sp. TaxID=2022749 RepID=UPI003D1143B9
MRAKPNQLTSARALNKSRSFFSVIKKNSLRRYRFFTLYGRGCLHIGYLKFMDSYKRDIDFIIDIYLNVFDSKTYLFGEWLMERKFYSHKEQIYIFTNSLFAIKESNVSWTYFKKIKKIVKELKN